MESSAFNDATCNPLLPIGMHFTRLHGMHCIQSRCMDSTLSIGIHFTTLHGLHCIQSQCMESTAFYQDALGHAAENPLHSIGMHWATLHRLHCIQSVSIAPQCKESSAFIDAAWTPLHSIGMLLPCCIKSTAFNRVPFLHTSWNTAFNHASWNPLHSIGMHFTRLHGIHCIQSRCMDSTAFECSGFHAA